MFYQTFWRGGEKKEKQLAFGWLLTACLGLLDFSALKGKVSRGSVIQSQFAGIVKVSPNRQIFALKSLKLLSQ